MTELPLELKKAETELRETLSELEHEQWMKWSGTLNERLGNWAELIARGKANVADVMELITEQHERWKKNWKPYVELDEATKEFDREWADKVLVVVASWLEEKLKELKNRLLKHEKEETLRAGIIMAINELDTVFGCELSLTKSEEYVNNKKKVNTSVNNNHKKTQVPNSEEVEGT